MSIASGNQTFLEGKGLGALNSEAPLTARPSHYAEGDVAKSLTETRIAPNRVQTQMNKPERRKKRHTRICEILPLKYEILSLKDIRFVAIFGQGISFSCR